MALSFNGICDTSLPPLPTHGDIWNILSQKGLRRSKKQIKLAYAWRKLQRMIDFIYRLLG